MPRDNLVSLLGLIQADWELASQLFADFEMRELAPEYGVPVTAEIKRNINPSTARRWLEGLYDSTDVTEMLPQVQVPTLVLHRISDALFPFTGAQEMATRIPNARLFALPGKGHLFVGDDVEQAVDAIVEFLDEDPQADPLTSQARHAATALATILFTDLVGHTDMMRRLGDDRGRGVLREHERITRDLLKAHGGTEVKTMGDGFMASFASVTKAVDCAIALQRAFAAHEGEPLQVRVGLNAGEPIEEDGDLFGATVIMASRVAAKAGAGEILIPEALRHLLTGKSYVYADRGETTLRGFEDAVRLYGVRWRD
jgi:class 3 adenylate cyclase